MSMVNNKDFKRVILATFFLVTGMLLIVIGTSIATPDSAVLRNQEVDNLSFTNASLEYKDDASTFKVEVTNTNQEIYNLKYINIIFTDEADNTNTLLGYIGNEINPNETKTIVASIDKDITNSVNLKYEIVK